MAETEVLAPSGSEELQEILRETSSSGGSVELRSGGSARDWGEPTSAATILELGGLSGIVAHDPADLTVTVRAGTSLSYLQQNLARSGQWLAVDPAEEGLGATIGGMLATNAYGPRRLRYGALRDLVIGANLVLADGQAVRSGGQVIKNVAGYDLARLMGGSLGTLAVITQLVLRLHPLPGAGATIRTPATLQQAYQAARTLSTLDPSALEWSREHLLVRIEGSPPGVAERSRRASDLLRSLGLDPEVPPECDATQAWDDLGRDWTGDARSTMATASTLPSKTNEVHSALADAVDRSGGATASQSTSLGLGLHLVRIEGDADAQAACLTSWRSAVEELGGWVMLRRRPAQVTERVAAWSRAPSAVGLMRQLKTRLDPHDSLNPGRFAPWF